MKYIPEPGDVDSSLFVEIIDSGHKSYTLILNHPDPRIPEQITVKITKYEQFDDPTSIRAYVKLVGNNGYQLTNHASFEDVTTYRFVYYQLELLNDSTNKILHCHGTRYY